MINTVGQIEHLIPLDTVDPQRVADELDKLIEDQNERIEADRPLSPVPLLWLAIAKVAGGIVNITEALITAKKSQLDQGRAAGLTYRVIATNKTNSVARIIDGPKAPPVPIYVKTERVPFQE
jgi:hypothetical protein